jgi:hypothetical protein
MNHGAACCVVTAHRPRFDVASSAHSGSIHCLYRIYHDRENRDVGSKTPADAERTTRVLAVMLAAGY